VSLIAYHGSESEKWQILLQLDAHARADELVKGKYWENGRGCAIGCTIHGADHAEYEPRFGIPQMLARLEDQIFEGLPNEEAKRWPIRFMGAVRPGADLARVGWQFMHWLLTDEKANPGITHPLVRDAVKQCADVLLPLTKGVPVDPSAARSAARSAASAAWSAASAARSAAWSAARSAARSAAWSAASAARSATSAARSAARSAESAAWSAESAESAAWSAAWSAESAESAERSAAYALMADKLVELIKAAPQGSLA